MAASKKTPQAMAAIVQSVRDGAYAKHAALAANIDESTLYDWRNADADFDQALEKACAERANAAIKRIEGHAERNRQADAWLLERTMPAFFREQKATELSGTVNLAGLADLADAS
jgi:hypothetical protein